MEIKKWPVGLCKEETQDSFCQGYCKSKGEKRSFDCARLVQVSVVGVCFVVVLFVAPDQSQVTKTGSKKQ